MVLCHALVTAVSYRFPIDPLAGAYMQPNKEHRLPYTLVSYAPLLVQGEPIALRAFAVRPKRAVAVFSIFRAGAHRLAV